MVGCFVSKPVLLPKPRGGIHRYPALGLGALLQNASGWWGVGWDGATGRGWEFLALNGH